MLIKTSLTAFAIGTSIFGFTAQAEELPPEILLGTKVQLFLDGSPFKPGKIDGRWGGFTEKALSRYQRAEGKGEVTFDGKDPGKLPFDLASIDPVFTDYEVTQADTEQIGEVPEKVEEKAKLERLAYADLAELVAEKFHVDRDFLGELNPDVDLAALKLGDSVKVPNVKAPFDIASVKQAEKPDEENGAAPEPEVSSVVISTTDNILETFKDDKLTGSYPISSGSEEVPAPKGDWKITSITANPDFRWDKQMLEEGTRSDNAHYLKPGPNNPVGVVWMAISSDGIGLHGTPSPDTIGRASSHGCIRLSNWDAIELSKKLAPGVPVEIK